MKKFFTLVTLLLIVGWATMVAQTKNVTFKVNMKVQAKKGFFNPATEVVTIPGGFNNWLNEPPANTEKVMLDSSAVDPVRDSIYTKVIALTPLQSYEYKYNIGLGWNGKDELGGQPNRSIIGPTTDSTLAPVWFNNEAMPSGAPANVTFEVDMRLPAKGIPNFSSRKVYVAGSFSNWGSGAILMTDANNDSVYNVTTPINSAQLIQYKFLHSPDSASNGSWETIDNRKSWIVDGNQTISKWWNDQNPNVTLADGNIFFNVDMSVLDELGVFNPGVDSVQVRGSFNDWNASHPEKSLLNQDPLNPNSWYLNVPFVQNVVGDTLWYKYFIKNPSGGFQYANTGWEVPIVKTSNGDRNRPVKFEGSGSQVIPTAFFDGIHTDWVIPTGTTVQATFSVDMTPATTGGTHPFVPTTDTVYWIPVHPLFYSVHGLTWNGARFLKLTDPNSDMIYTGTMTLNGPSFNGFLYQYGYGGSSGLIQEEGSQGQARVRFVGQSGGARHFDSPWNMPQDVWTNGEKPEEEKPQGWTDIKEINGGLLKSFSLEQNYPNPFNPATIIRFTIPDAGLVSLSVYNLLGEKVGEVLNQEMNSGSFEVSFNASNLSSGVYFYTIKTGNYTASKKMMLMK